MAANRDDQEYATMAKDAPSRRSRRFTRFVARLALASAVGVAVVPVTTSVASASLLGTLLPACASQQTGTPFAAWGDSSSYFLMPGGGFESGTPGWVAGGATVVDDNETYFAGASTDAHSLSMPTGALAVSPTVCVAMGENTIRFFVKNSGVASSVLHVQAYVQNPLTGLVLSTGADIQGNAGATGWSPSPRILIPNLLGGVLGTQRLTLVFSTRGVPAAWNIDDVFVDPFKSR
jgi:hypothetical protein